MDQQPAVTRFGHGADGLSELQGLNGARSGIRAFTHVGLAKGVPANVVVGRWWRSGSHVPERCGGDAAYSACLPDFGLGLGNAAFKATLIYARSLRGSTL